MPPLPLGWAPRGHAGGGGVGVGWPPRLALSAAAAILALAVAAAVAARATSAEVIPFPAPPDGGDPGGGGATPPAPFGRFHTLPGLGCDVRSHGEGTPPGQSDAIRVRASGKDAPMVVVPRGDRTCATPVTEAATLAALREPTSHDGRRDCPVLQDAFRGPPSANGVQHEPLLDADDPRGGLRYERHIFRLLTLLRNTAEGGVLRMTGAFDVAAVIRVGKGLCSSTKCYEMYAVDAARTPVVGVNTPDRTWVPVITLRHRDGAPPELVPDADEALLSLGRAVQAQPQRFRQHPEWGNVSLIFDLRVNSWPGILPDSLVMNWVVNAPASKRDAANTTGWLPTIANTLCAPPARSFVRDPERLCGGLLEPLPPALDEAPSGPVVDGVALATAARASSDGRSVTWHIRSHTFLTEQDLPTDATQTSDPPTPPGTVTREPVPPGPWQSDPPDDMLPEETPSLERPCWLTGLGAREVNPNSPDEVALAARIGIEPRLVHRSDGGEAHFWPGSRLMTGHERWLSERSTVYDRGLFGVDPPEDPSSTSDLVLAVVVVVPELVALVVMLISTHTWRWRDVCVLGFIFLSGLISIAGLISLVRREVAGDAWRAAGVRHQLFEDDVANGSRYGAHRAMRLEMLVLIARPGYRPAMLTRVAIAVGVVYVAFSALATATVWALRRWRRRHPLGNGAGGGGDVEDGIVEDIDGGIDAARAGGAAAAARWWRRTRRRARAAKA